MKCEFCSAAATVHITDVHEGKHRELHLCKDCAAKEKVASIVPPSGSTHGGLNEFVKSMINAFAGPNAELATLACSYCGTQFMEFRSKGRLGCPADYETFEKGLLPLIEMIHGKTRHVGKSPRRAAGMAIGESLRLRRDLRAAVESENFEQAARLRDQLRARMIPHEFE